MTELRVSQAGTEYLFRVLPGAKVSQAGVEFLLRVEPGITISQAGVEFLYKAMPCTTQDAQVWTITRKDGVTYRFTSLDRDMVWLGHTYSACGGLLPTASESANDVGSIANMDVAGLIRTNSITEADLFGGRFDGADLEAWLVPWQGEKPPRMLLKGRFGKVTHGPAGFSVEALGDGSRFSQTPLIQTVQPGCRWVFGSAECGIDLGPLTVTGTVSSAGSARAFTDTDRGEAPGYFTYGLVTFTSGDNNGITAEIRSHAAGGVFALWPGLASPIMIGDTYSMTPGCTLNKAADGGTKGCTAWANVVNYGGFDKLPGQDALKKTPTART
jgi:uncharacterized phage protein (TIGR02218 family)